MLILLVAGHTKAQTLADTIRNEIAAINQVYDSAFYLTFDIKTVYDSDTLYANTDSADFEHSEMLGTYTFHRNKALYKLGAIEFLQNDSFTIAVYKDDKFMMVGKPPTTQQPGILLPNRVLLDSMLSQLFISHEYDLLESDSINTIVFKSNYPGVKYKKILLEYEPVTHYILKVRYEFKDDGYSTREETVDAEIRNAVLTFHFLNYRADQVGAAVFDETKYLFFDGPTVFKPTAAYKDFTIYKNY